MGTRDPQSFSAARERNALFKLFLYAVAAAALLSAPPAAAEMQRRTLFLGETIRDYLLFVPDQRPSRGSGMPLVVALHGGGAVADMMLMYSRFNEVAAREQFAVAYPYGTNRWWNDGRLIEGRPETDADDVGFIRALVADVDARVAPLDRRRIYATGISSGGFMSLRLACEAADLFAAVAPVAATMPAELGVGCRPSRPVSVLLIHGTADRQVPYVGGYARTASMLRGAIWSADHTIAFWAWHNRCAHTPVLRVLADRDPADGSHVVESDYQGCAGAAVTLLRVEGGGHTWPGAVNILPTALLGTTNRDIDATEAIWSFFQSTPAREGAAVHSVSRSPPPGRP
jgi:polyhydroxybutyrate depolymerase